MEGVRRFSSYLRTTARLRARITPNLCTKMSLCRKCGLLFQLRTAQIGKTLLANSRRGAFFSRGDNSAEEEEDVRPRKIHGGDGHITRQQLNHIAGKSRTLTAHKPYSPPADVEDRVEQVVRQVMGVKTPEDWQETSLSDPRLKFKILSQLIREFDHDIPGFTMTDMKTVEDAVNYFYVGVKETSALEDLKDSALPPNLHINTEYVRFNPDTDTMFEGRTAYPGADTIVTSIKYKRKYDSIRTTKPKAGYENHYYGY